MPSDRMTTIAELREMEVRATPGPWSCLDQYLDCDNGPLPIASGWYAHMTMEGGQHYDAAVANAALIVALRNALPSLLDRIEAQDGEISSYRNERAALQATAGELAGDNGLLRACALAAEASRDRLAEALRELAKPYFWTEDGFRGDASTPAHRSQDLHRRLTIARSVLATLETPDAGWSL